MIFHPWKLIVFDFRCFVVLSAVSVFSGCCSFAVSGTHRTLFWLTMRDMVLGAFWVFGHSPEYPCFLHAVRSPVRLCYRPGLPWLIYHYALFQYFPDKKHCCKCFMEHCSMCAIWAGTCAISVRLFHALRYSVPSVFDCSVHVFSYAILRHLEWMINPCSMPWDTVIGCSSRKH